MAPIVDGVSHDAADHQRFGNVGRMLLIPTATVFLAGAAALALQVQATPQAAQPDTSAVTPERVELGRAVVFRHTGGAA